MTGVSFGNGDTAWSSGLPLDGVAWLLFVDMVQTVTGVVDRMIGEVELSR
jgi:hypothetical protein